MARRVEAAHGTSSNLIFYKCLQVSAPATEKHSDFVRNRKTGLPLTPVPHGTRHISELAHAILGVAAARAIEPFVQAGDE
jgi:hypothetical protein